MLAAARKYEKVVQVGTQRRSTPHLMEAKRDFIDTGLLGKVSHVDICCYYHMRRRGVFPEIPVPANLDYEMWTSPAPMIPYTEIHHPRGWRAFMEYSNGIVGDMCVHMLDMTRWMLGLGWPDHVSSTGGIFLDKESTANITDTQTATFAYPGSEHRLEPPLMGRSREPRLSLVRHPLRRQGHPQSLRQRLRIHPARRKGKTRLQRGRTRA